MMSEETYRQEMAAKLRAARLAKGETQEDVARAIDVPLSVYRGWERGTRAPRGAAWLRLCEHFGWAHPLLTGESSLSIETASDLPFYHRTPLLAPETLVGVS